MIRFETTFCGKTISLQRPRFKRLLWWQGGEVARGIPVVVRWSGLRTKNKAKREAERLRQYGYRVRIKYEKAPRKTGEVSKR